MIVFKQLRLRSITKTRIFGADIPFDYGLNVIQAHNTSGKSTSLQAIIFALGLERALGPQLSVPLPYAMRERIHEAEEAPYEVVLQSYVEVEVENDRGDVLVIHRDVVGGADTRLIRTWSAPILTGGASPGEERDFFVLDPGSAQREDGFHNFLAKFIGWDLPNVPRYDGSEGPLYLEALFPMLFVEQKRGWSAIQGPFPTFLKIQDVARRVVEFLFDLDAARVRRARSELRGAIGSLVGRWAVQRKVLEDQSAKIGRVRGIPALPTAEFALAPTISLELYRDDVWTPLSDVVDQIVAQIADLEARQEQSTEEAAPESQARLFELRESVDSMSAVLEVIRGEHSAEYLDFEALSARVDSLKADLHRNQDAAKLQRLGSALGHAAHEHVCPTCHQDVASELLPAVENVGMGLEENITFVKSQIELYETALAGARERLRDLMVRYQSIERELREKQYQLRSLRQALLRPSSAPSRVAIEEIVRLQNYLDRVHSTEEVAAGLTDQLQAIAQEWADLTDQLKKLPSDELTSVDKRKVDAFEASIRRQLSDYGFKSFQPSEICISRDNFRPLLNSRDKNGDLVEKEINFEISASDGIRLKWAYYIAAMELAKSEVVNHPSLIIFDEPGQQEIEASSLYAFLKVADAKVGPKQQIIISTSEPIAGVRQALGLTDGQTGRDGLRVVEFGGFILQPIQARPA